MADSKITALTALTAADPVNDMFPVVDVSDTTMAASGTTKKISVNNILSSSPTASGALTVTGLVTAGSATITGAATVTGAANLNGAVNLSTSGTPTVTLGSTTTYGLLQAGGTNAASIYLNGGTRSGVPAYTFYAAAEHQFYNSTLATLIATLNTTGLTLSNSNLVIGTSGKGIDFSATANSSGTMTSELLNDYEEGTFTATLTGTVANPTIPVTTTGRYTKIGRIVSISAFFSSVITTGASGRIQITGLPFTNNSSITSVGTVAFNSMATFTGSPFASLAASDTTIIMFSSNSAASYASVNFNAGITQDLWVSLNYTVA